MMRLSLSLSLLAWLALPVMAATSAEQKLAQITAQAPSKILFGSCMHQDKKMPIFNAINKENADLFIFLGDNIYGDTRDMQVMQDEYHRLSLHQGFQQLKQTTPMIAIWDDHDFGENDAGRDYPKKQKSRQLMLDFWQEPKNSARYTREDGIYTSYIYGKGEQSVQVIMPDLRWNRPPLNHVTMSEYNLQRKPKNMGPYLPAKAPNTSMLGEKQWQWLEQELLKPAKIKIIASSLQLLPEFTGWESWANYPYDRTRLLMFIKQHHINGVVMISGDTHWGELSKVTAGQDYPLYEMTSSGLTQEWKYVSPNQHRLGKALSSVNYGELAINWQLKDPELTLKLKDKKGREFIKQQLKLSEISPYAADLAYKTDKQAAKNIVVVAAND